MRITSSKTITRVAAVTVLLVLLVTGALTMGCGGEETF